MAPGCAMSNNLCLDEAGRVRLDLRCRSCGYNLRTLARDDACPECARRADESLRDDLLIFSDRVWLLRVRRGVLLVPITAIAMIVLVVLSGLLPNAILPGGFAVIFLCLGLAAWLVTSPEPRERGPAARVAARFLLVTSAVLHAVALAFVIMVRFTGGSPGTRTDTILTVALVLGCIGLMPLFVYVTRCTRRIPDDGLTLATKIAAWCVLGYVVQQWVHEILPRQYQVWHLIASALLLCAIVTTLIAIVRFARRLRQVAELPLPAAGGDGATSPSAIGTGDSGTRRTRKKIVVAAATLVAFYVLGVLSNVITAQVVTRRHNADGKRQVGATLQYHGVPATLVAIDIGHRIALPFVLVTDYSGEVKLAEERAGESADGDVLDDEFEYQEVAFTFFGLRFRQ